MNNLKPANNKGHAPFSAKEVFIFMVIIYTIVFSAIFSASGCIAIMLKKTILKHHSVLKMAWIISVIIVLSLVAYSYISQWHWQHYGFYYSYRDDQYIFKDPQYELKKNGEIYHLGKPFIVRGKYYGWEMVH